jgi:putative chitinase
MSLIPPNKYNETIVNDFILYATGHLATVGGIINTISLYPAAPSPVPGPGVIIWTGYQIPPARPSLPPLDVTPMTDDQLSVSILGSLDGLSIGDATSLALTTDFELTPPTLTLTEAELLFDNSINLSPIPEPTVEELEQEVLNLSKEITTPTESDSPLEESTDTPVQNSTPVPTKEDDEELTEEEKAALAKATETLKAINTNPEQVPNYQTNIKVPNDMILAMRRWKVGVDSPLERAHFLSQCAHESGGFKWKQEIWGPSPAQKGYEGRSDLGNNVKGDGYRYRGRGYIQLTGRANYVTAEKILKGDIVNNPDNVSAKYPGDSACYFWTRNALKKIAKDATDDTVTKLTARINGGDNGLPDRKKKFLVYWNELKRDPTLWT